MSVYFDKKYFLSKSSTWENGRIGPVSARRGLGRFPHPVDFRKVCSRKGRFGHLTAPVDIAEAVRRMTPDERARMRAELRAEKVRREAEAVKTPTCHRFIPFIQRLWPSFRLGRHHQAIADAFERIRDRRLKRLMINLPPRHGKSECASVYLPAWWMGQFPDAKIIAATHTEKLSIGFGRRVRNLLRDPDFAEIFPGCEIAKDSKAAGKWGTTKGGEYHAVGVGTALAGRGANLMLIDDPHSEQDVLANPEATFEKAYDWYQTGPRQRLQPGAAVVINATRWSKRDLCGRLLADAKNDPLADQWEVLSLPAILPDGMPLFPEYWPINELEQLRRTLPPQRWNAQYQQNPVSIETAIVKPDSWKCWSKRLPKIEYLVQSWDTSFGEYAHGDPSACVLWGVFHPRKEAGQSPSQPRYGVILLDAFEARLEFPELKQKALEFYRAAKPDSLVIEARSAGSPLLQELQRMGLPIARYAPTRGDDKTTRLNAVSDLFSSGMVWYLDSCPLARRVIQQMAEHPNGDADDLMDASVQALLRIRDGGLIRLSTDIDDEDIDAADERAARRAALIPAGGYY